jgi:hypothetical protein
MSGNNDELPAPLLVKPREAWRMLNCSNTRGYKLLAENELESFLDGRSRKITVDSIYRYIKRRLNAQSQPSHKPPSGKQLDSPFVPIDSDNNNIYAPTCPRPHTRQLSVPRPSPGDRQASIALTHKRNRHGTT